MTTAKKTPKKSSKKAGKKTAAKKQDAAELTTESADKPSKKKAGKGPSLETHSVRRLGAWQCLEWMVGRLGKELKDATSRWSSKLEELTREYRGILREELPTDGSVALDKLGRVKALLERRDETEKRASADKDARNKKLGQFKAALVDIKQAELVTDQLALAFDDPADTVPGMKGLAPATIECVYVAIKTRSEFVPQEDDEDGEWEMPQAMADLLIDLTTKGVDQLELLNAAEAVAEAEAEADLPDSDEEGEGQEEDEGDEGDEESAESGDPAADLQPENLPRRDIATAKPANQVPF